MIGGKNSRQGRSRYPRFQSDLNRTYSPALAYLVPWATVMIGSILASIPVVAGPAIIPPFGLLALLSWRLLRPGLLPVWAGLPLGLFDDLFSGQPVGSATLLWSLIMLIIEYAENNIPWRGFYQDWAFATLLIGLCLFAGAAVSGAPITITIIEGILVQLLLSALAYPIIARMVSWFDKIRLKRFRVVR